MSLLETIVNWIKSLFSKKPSKPKLIEFKWSGIGTTPDSGSWAFGPGDNSKPVQMDANTGIQPVPAGELVKMVVTTTPAVPGYLSVILYKHVMGSWVGGWAPEVKLNAGESRAELVFDPTQRIDANMALRAWGGYPAGVVANDKPIDIHVSVFIKK